MKRLRMIITGLVQGVGFRPCVFRLASELNLTGWIRNTAAGVQIELQGSEKSLNDFNQNLDRKKPPNCQIWSLETNELSLQEEEAFAIRESNSSEPHNAVVLPDLATCSDCLQEILAPGNRRYLYPFTNCTGCGPRCSILCQLPYDRKNTTMSRFAMCNNCQKEYEDPYDRRFHAQPNACPVCGPQLALLDCSGNTLAVKEDALIIACEKIRQGGIIALKGIGGFQLIADASNEKSVKTLRMRKHRQEKPFALLFPSMEQIRQYCRITLEEEQLLQSQSAPIVLLKAHSSPSSQIAPGNPYLGVMLPYSPLHHLMMRELNMPVIATSGNRGGEPICTDDTEALFALNGIADAFLTHNRPIACGVDDSIVQMIHGRKMLLRRARGYSSVPIQINRQIQSSLSVGGQLKNTIAAGKGDRIYLSQHIGDLENQKSHQSFTREINRLQRLYEIRPQIVVSDCHPAYESSKFASTLQIQQRRCQHHLAHVYSCMAEQRVEPPLLGVSWDGTGYGLDRTVWGGEFFSLNPGLPAERIATFRSFILPLGSKAVSEPRLCALGLLYEVFGEKIFEMRHLPPLKTLSERQIENYKKILRSEFQSPRCTSVGRIFDAIASLLGLCQKSSFEGQAAMELEFLCEEACVSDPYSFEINHGQKKPHLLNWEPMLREIMQEIDSGRDRRLIAQRFHRTCVEMITAVAEISSLKKIVLSGGAFQNRVLLEAAIEALRDHKEVYWHENIPPNDGGIALGQLYSLCV